jgi:hypothetical protein
VERHDQVVLGPRAGHVEQPDALVVRHLLVERDAGLVRLRDDRAPDPDQALLAGRPQHLGPRPAALGLGRQPGEDGDRELQPLGGVDGHDPDRVVVGLGQDGLGDPAALRGLLADPGQVLAQRAVGGVGPGPGLVDHEPHPAPQVAGPAVGLAELEDPAVAHHPVGQLAGRRPQARRVQLAQVGEPRGHRVARRDVLGRRGAVVEAAAVGPPVAVEVVVAAGEQGRAQCGDDRQLVARVVDRPQGEEDVPDQPAGVHEGRRLGPVGDAGRTERVLQRWERRPGRQQDRDVAEPGRPPAGRAAAAVVADQPALVEHAPDGGGDVGRLALAEHRRAGPVLVRGSAEHGDRRADRGVRADRDQRGVGRLRRHAAHVLGPHEVAEHEVDQVDDRPARAEVCGQREAAPARAEAVGGLEEQRDVRPPEAVDRLLGVAHEEQVALAGGDLAPRRVRRGVVVGGDEHGQLDLDRVGVLELVDQQVPVALPQRRPDRGAVVGVAQHVAGEDQQVVELELACPAPLVGRLEREAPQVDRQARDRRDGHLAPQRAGPVPDVLVALLEGGEVVARPVGRPAVGAAARCLAEQPELGVLVAGRLDPAGPGLEVGELGQQLVVLGAASVALGDDRIDVGQQAVEPAGPVRDLAGRRRGAVAGEVPVLVEGERDQPQAVGTDAARGGQEERALDRRVGEQLVEEAAPPVVERHRRRDLVQHLDARWEARLDRVLAEDALGEAVERPDRGAVEVVERGAAAGRPLGVGRAARAARGIGAVGQLGGQRSADPVAQLGRCLLGEGDRGDRVERRSAAGDEPDDAVDERARLARAGPRLDEQGGGEVVRDAVACDLVRRGAGGSGGGRGGHGRPSGSTRLA